MKGDRDLQRALLAKIEHGEGSERETALRVWKRRFGALPITTTDKANKRPPNTRGVTMEMLFKEFGDIFRI
jgi:hypothetical protein